MRWLVAGLVFGASLAWAGNVQVAYRYADCTDVARLDIYVAPLTVATPNPQPADAILAGSIPIAGPQDCATTSIYRSVTITGETAGITNRFWLRGVPATGAHITSTFSNQFDVLLPSPPTTSTTSTSSTSSTTIRPPPLPAPGLTAVLPLP